MQAPSCSIRNSSSKFAKTGFSLSLIFMSANIQNLTSSDFDSAISGGSTPVLVDFWAPWCGPCKAIAPILEELASELDGQVKITKVNIDDNGDVASKFNIRAIPTLLIFKNGNVVDQIVGNTGKEDLKSRLSKHL